MMYSFEKSLGKITHQVSKGLGRKLVHKFAQQNYHLNSSQWTVISYLSSHKEGIQKEISEFIGVNKVMMKRILDSLEKEGYVKRIPVKSDKRQNKIRLTRKGEKLYETLTPFAEETLQEAYSGLSEQEINQCLNTLKKIQETLSQSG